MRAFVERLSGIEKKIGLAKRVPIESWSSSRKRFSRRTDAPRSRSFTTRATDVCGAHFGTYDYTASLGITAAHQHDASIPRAILRRT